MRDKEDMYMDCYDYAEATTITLVIFTTYKAIYLNLFGSVLGVAVASVCLLFIQPNHTFLCQLLFIYVLEILQPNCQI